MSLPTWDCKPVCACTRDPLSQQTKPDDAACLATLRHALRVARWNEQQAKRVAAETVKNVERLGAEARDGLRRARSLLNVRRKTVPMRDLRVALGLDDESAAGTPNQDGGVGRA